MLDRFYLDDMKPSYTSQVARRFADLSPYPDAVAAALELPAPNPAAPYRIRAMFVTREPTPAQFVGGPFPFTPLANLIKIPKDPPEAS